MNTCVIIPVYKESPSDQDLSSIRRTLDVFSKRDVIYVCPESLDLRKYPSIRCERFPDHFFRDLRGYSELCCSSQFYLHFIDWDYMLICQPDCWVFDDRLDYFTSLEYDYIGAPWYHIKRVPDDSVGNGGLSLRRTKRFAELSDLPGEHHPEDVWWCVTMAEHLNIAPPPKAAEFSLEHHPQRWYDRTGGIMPMGCHKPWALGYYDSFWRAAGVPPLTL